MSSKLNKKRLFTALAGVALLSAGVMSVNSKADAATNESPIHGVITVTYNGKGKVCLLNGNGQYQNQFLSKNTKWRTFAKAVINGQTMYRLGTDKQWIPEKYTNMQSVTTTSSNSVRADVVTIKYVPGYGINVYSAAQNGSYVGKRLQHNTSWKMFREANGNDGYVWYNLGGNQWISSRYTNKPKKASVSNFGSNNSSVTKPTTPSQPSKPATPNKPNVTNNQKPTTPSKPAESTKPTTPAKPSKPVQQAEPFDASKVEMYLMQKINALRTSTYLGENADGSNIAQKKGNGLLNAYQPNAEVQALANLRLNEIFQSYSHTRPNGEEMNVAEYRKLLPTLGKNIFVGGFAECIGAFPGTGMTNEQSAQLLFDGWTVGDYMHKAGLMSSLHRNGYAAVAVRQVNGELYAVFEMAGKN